MPTLRQPAPLDPFQRPVGTFEIADLLAVSRSAVDVWRSRYDHFPEPAWQVGNRPAWRLGDVVEWCADHGRLDSFPSIWVRLRSEDDRATLEAGDEWNAVASLPPELCVHTVTACSECVDSWALDHEVSTSDEVPA